MDRSYTDIINDVENNLQNVSRYDNWPAIGCIHSAAAFVKEDFMVGYRRAKNDLSYILNEDLDAHSETTQTEALILSWHDGRTAYSLGAILAAGLDILGFDVSEDRDLILPVMMAAVLGEITNNLVYHNNMHFRKVALHTIRMIKAHNMLNRDTCLCMDKNKIVCMLSAAAIHDLDHNGRGNIVDRKYYVGLTEKRSFDLAQPYLKQAGLSDISLQDIRTMLISTDVSPFGDPISPSYQVRAAYEYHFGTDEGSDDLELCDDLAQLENRAGLCLMCLMLHEADIMNSAGVSYKITKIESVAISKEIGRQSATPEDTLLFLEKICGGHMLSDASRYLAGENFQSIRKDTIDDYKDGNKGYTSD